MTPDFLLIGGQRCGTTSLFRALMQHPQVVRPTFHKGVNYFDLNYYRGPAWYAGHFPVSTVASRRITNGAKPVAFEASGYYMSHPMALSRIAQDMPDVKLVALLRDPVERAFSAWKHESERGYDSEDFVGALRLERSRVEGEADRMIADPTYESFTHRHQSYRGRGEYLRLLEPVAGMMSRDQLHIIYSEDFFADPVGEFDRLAVFLGLQQHNLTQFDRYNARPSASMPAEGRSILNKHFDGQRAALESFVGRPAPWPTEGTP